MTVESLASTLRCYKTLPQWNAETLPTLFRKMHNTKEGTWARLTVLSGALKFYALDADGNEQSTVTFTPDSDVPFISPQAWHRVEPVSDDLLCYLSFYCEPERYYEKKYGLSPPHPEVQAVVGQPARGTALDLGCGRGRNSIYLQQQGYQVTALDQSQAAVDTLKKIIGSESEVGGIDARCLDIVGSGPWGEFDLIVSTVVLQFIDSDKLPEVLANMQQSTKAGGINLIVTPLSTPEVPCPIDWPGVLGAGDLRATYQHWELIRYEEAMGEFHRQDEHGNNYRSLFATIVARKP